MRVPQEPEAVLAFIHERAVTTDAGCWEWPHRRDDGYGIVRYKKVRWRVHRLTYHHLHTALSKAVVVHHKCGNRSCCNPAHLQGTTAAANTAEMFQRQALLATIQVQQDEIHSLLEELIELQAQTDRDHQQGEEQ